MKDTSRYFINDAHTAIGNFATHILNIFGHFDTEYNCISPIDYISIKEDIEKKKRLSHSGIISILTNFNNKSINDIIIMSIIINKDIYVDTYNEYIEDPEEFNNKINRIISCKNKSKGRAKSEAYDILIDYTLGTDRIVRFTNIIDLGNHKEEKDLVDTLDNIESKFEQFIYAISLKYPKFMPNNVLYLDVEKISKISGLSLKEVSFFIKLLAQPQFNVWRLQKSTLNRNNIGSIQTVILCDDIEIPMINKYDAFDGFTYKVSYKLKTTKNICVENEEYMKHIGKRYNIILPTIFETNQNMISLPDGSFGVLNEKKFIGLEQSYNSILSRRLFNAISITDVVGNLKFKNNIRMKKKTNPNFKIDNINDPHFKKLTKIVHYSDLTEYEAGELLEEYKVIDNDGDEYIKTRKKKVYTNINVCTSKLLELVQQLSEKGINTDGRDFSFKDEFGIKHKIYWDRQDMLFTVDDLRCRIIEMYNTKQITENEYINNMLNYDNMIKSLTSSFYIKGKKENANCKQYAENYVDRWNFDLLNNCEDLTFTDLLNMPLKTALALEMSFSFIERMQKVSSSEIKRDVKSFAINVVNSLNKMNIEEMENKDLYLRNRILEFIEKDCETKIEKAIREARKLVEKDPEMYKEEIEEYQEKIKEYEEEKTKYINEEDPETILYSYYNGTNLWEAGEKITSLLNEFNSDYKVAQMEYKQQLDILKSFKLIDRLTLREKCKIHKLTEKYNKITGKELEITNFKIKVTNILDEIVEQNKYNCNKLKNYKKNIQDKQDKKEITKNIKLFKEITKLSKTLKRSLKKSKKLTEYIDCELNKQNIKMEVVCTKLYDKILEVESKEDDLLKYFIHIDYIKDLKEYLLLLLKRKYEIKQGADYSINELCNLEMIYNRVIAA